jgi:hypothetical protein
MGLHGRFGRHNRADVPAIRATRSHVGWDQETRDRVLTRDSNRGLRFVADFILVGLFRGSGWVRWTVWMGPMLAAGAIASRWTVTTRWAVWPRMASAFFAISWGTITARWSVSAHSPRTFFGVAAWTIVARRTFRSPMTMSVFALVRRRAHFVMVATARTVKVVPVRWAIETLVC